MLRHELYCCLAVYFGNEHEDTGTNFYSKKKSFKIIFFTFWWSIINGIQRYVNIVINSLQSNQSYLQRCNILYDVSIWYGIWARFPGM
jgi:hypothetical protein